MVLMVVSGRAVSSCRCPDSRDSLAGRQSAHDLDPATADVGTDGHRAQRRTTVLHNEDVAFRAIPHRAEPSRLAVV